MIVAAPGPGFSTACANACRKPGISAATMISAAPPKIARGLWRPELKPRLSQAMPASGPLARVVITKASPGKWRSREMRPRAAESQRSARQPARVADEAAQHPPRVRRRAHAARQLLVAVAFARQRFLAGAHVAAHVGGGKFGMELHAPGAIAPPERVAGIVHRLREYRRAFGRAQHALQVRGLCREPCGQAAEQRSE